MRKPLNARSTQFVKIQTSARATLGANPASSASRHPIRRPFSPAHGVSLSRRHCGSARAGQTHPLRVNAPTRVKHTTAAARCGPGQENSGHRGRRPTRSKKCARGPARQPDVSNMLGTPVPKETLPRTPPVLTGCQIGPCSSLRFVGPTTSECLPPVGVGRNIDAEVPRADLSGRVV